MSDFWTRKKQELQEQGVIPRPSVPVTQSDGPWWAQGTSILPKHVKEPQKPPQPHTGLHTPLCPVCRSDSFLKPTATTAARCFDCGHIEGRITNDQNMPSGLITGGVKTLKVRQSDSGGHFGRSVAEINQNNAILEQSAQGRAKLT